MTGSALVVRGGGRSTREGGTEAETNDGDVAAVEDTGEPCDDAEVGAKEDPVCARGRGSGGTGDVMALWSPVRCSAVSSDLRCMPLAGSAAGVVPLADAGSEGGRGWDWRTGTGGFVPAGDGDELAVCVARRGGAASCRPRPGVGSTCVLDVLTR